jgi:5-methylcytosine-specific restriction endonuclease McrA
MHERGYKCDKGLKISYKKDYDKLRSTYAWTQKAKQIKEDANNLCEVCRAKGIYTYNDLEVHHITKLRDNPDGLLDDGNLVCLCTTHHKQADDGLLDADMLRKLAQLRDNNQLWL